jgi:hypothetical protein
LPNWSHKPIDNIISDYIKRLPLYKTIESYRGRPPLYLPLGKTVGAT